MAKENKSKNLGTDSIILGVLSFIPMFGIIIGIIAIIFGIMDIRKNKGSLGIIGLTFGILGIFTTCVLFYFGVLKGWFLAIILFFFMGDMAI